MADPAEIMHTALRGMWAQIEESSLKATILDRLWALGVEMRERGVVLIFEIRVGDRKFCARRYIDRGLSFSHVEKQDADLLGREVVEAVLDQLVDSWCRHG